jgi:hypothetical protein
MQPVERTDSEVFELKETESRPDARPVFEADAPPTRGARVDNGAEAEFVLEATAVCPHCLEDIERVQIVRMLRMKVNFVSSLPRRGQLLVCPNCRIALAGALGGLI